jgi:hypothetical protein
MTIIVCESRFSMKKEDRDRQDSFAEYLDDIKEWNEHQYNEGYWSGGEDAAPAKVWRETTWNRVNTSRCSPNCS